MFRILLAATVSLFVSVPSATADGLVVVRAIEGRFEDIRARVVFAVETQGLVVDHVSKVGAMLARTGQDLGETTEIYGDAEVLEFCSALVSRRMVEANPQLLAFCPYRIAVYTLPGKPDTTYVSYVRMVTDLATPAQRPALERVETLLETIVEEASM